VGYSDLFLRRQRPPHQISGEIAAERLSPPEALYLLSAKTEGRLVPHRKIGKHGAQRVG
jgi:hypothetical protein